MQQKSLSPPAETPAYVPQTLEFPSTDAGNVSGDPNGSSLFDWSDFLDFDMDDNLNLAFDPPAINGPEPESGPDVDPVQPQNQQPSNSTRVRKRDPRLICSNFLAGRVPCACPELDEKLEQEASGDLPGKKRVRPARIPAGATARCQVPECEADISELKGYHRRHRICLRCANASTVVLDGESKRYCQQCGKFHILSDFDEGKRSCRRKLEHHNRRRRRRPNGSKGSIEKESRQVVLVDDVSCDDDTGKDSICLSSEIAEPETLLESGHVSTISSGLGSQTIQSDSFLSFAASGETRVDGEKENPKQKNSLSCENKSTFSSACRAGRISFKLYDWNPAEFPRRLRHQIFEWLAGMPVELEGYIRPGCTILTAFIAMPKLMWLKVLEEPAKCIRELLASPGNMLSGRMHVYLDDKIFRIIKDDFVEEVKVKERAPKLHSVYPTCFEAGKPMQFVACGTNLLQPQFRFLVSFSGRYLAYNICVSSVGRKKEGDNNSADHELLKIYVPPTDLNVFGPAFVEVENQSGLSNFIPILIGNKEVCEEMVLLQQKFSASHGSKEQQLSCPRPACERLASRQADFPGFLLEVAWSLKKPVSDQQLASTQMQRFNYLLNFLIERESTIILESVLDCMKSAMDNTLVVGISDADMKLFRGNMDNARHVLHRKLEEKEYSVMHASDGKFSSQSSQHDSRSSVPSTNQGFERTKNKLESRVVLPSLDESVTVPLLNGEVMGLNLKKRPGRLFTRTVLTSRPLVFAIVVIGVCFGLCAVVLHPHKAALVNSSVIELKVAGKIHIIPDESVTVPLLNGEVMGLNLKKRPGRLFTRTVLTSRPLVFAIVVIGVCFGLCAVVLHPHKAALVNSSVIELKVAGKIHIIPGS
ncbi:unnamed protein product [Fraxinus pennsylvanica]|uniref:SBP-type domain-containing protein n=1 Tax=Fraxinus pennsylvanica TaxID=56036 RepID=A0AAD1ZYH5_9LAMI|nr:unnamed protein product [Fraxinus pennsylvanica]